MDSKYIVILPKKDSQSFNTSDDALDFLLKRYNGGGVSMDFREEFRLHLEDYGKIKLFGASVIKESDWKK